MRTWMIILGALAVTAMTAGCTPRDQQKDPGAKAAKTADEGESEPVPKPGSECRVFFKADMLSEKGIAAIDGQNIPHKGDMLEGKIHEVTTEWVALDVPATGTKGFNRFWIAKDSVLFLQVKE